MRVLLRSVSCTISKELLFASSQTQIILLCFFSLYLQKKDKPHLWLSVARTLKPSLQGSTSHCSFCLFLLLDVILLPVSFASCLRLTEVTGDMRRIWSWWESISRSQQVCNYTWNMALKEEHRDVESRPRRRGVTEVIFIPHPLQKCVTSFLKLWNNPRSLRLFKDY